MASITASITPAERSLVRKQRACDALTSLAFAIHGPGWNSRGP
jgi:hypothetical protein